MGENFRKNRKEIAKVKKIAKILGKFSKKLQKFSKKLQKFSKKIVEIFQKIVEKIVETYENFPNPLLLPTNLRATLKVFLRALPNPLSKP